jgi:hypothetical protein
MKTTSRAEKAVLIHDGINRGIRRIETLAGLMSEHNAPVEPRLLTETAGMLADEADAIRKALVALGKLQEK